jgi:hypothetical protein
MVVSQQDDGRTLEDRVRKIWVGIGAAVIVLAFVAGFWPQHRQLTAAQTLAATLQAELDAAEARARLAAVLGELLHLSDAVRNRNYGEAASLSSTYFDAVRQEASRADAETRAVLDSLLNSRDQVTTAIAGADAGLDVTLRMQERQLRRALGYPTHDGA